MGCSPHHPLAAQEYTSHWSDEPAEFDPNEPFEEVGSAPLSTPPVEFDPNQPFEIIGDWPPTPPQRREALFGVCAEIK